MPSRKLAENPTPRPASKPAAKGGKHILLTGVTRGLGRALAARFIEMGHTVCGCGRAADIVVKLCQQYDDQNDFAVVNVADDQQVQTWVQRILENFGPPDLVVNNAALINQPAPLWKVPPAEFDQVVDVNIRGVANVLRHVVPAMVERKAGIIVNISSGWGRSVAADVAPYCATKWAIEGLTKALAEELPRGMAAVPLNPGVIDTNMLRASFGDSAGQYPDADAWSHKAAPFLLQLGPKHNGQSLSVPE